LKLSNIYFEEERKDTEERIAGERNSEEDISDDEDLGLLARPADLPPPAITRNYGSTDVGNNKSDIHIKFDSA